MIEQEKLNIYLKMFQGLKAEDLQEIAPFVKKKSLKKEEIYIKEGERRKKVAYIKSGLIRIFAVKENGVEVTVLLRREDQFVASHHAVILEEPSIYYFQALEPTDLLEVDHDEIQKVLAQNPKFERIRQYFLKQMLAQALTQIESFILLSPEERYKEFLNKNADLLNRVPIKYIANLLGITPVSLSRIRKRIANS